MDTEIQEQETQEQQTTKVEDDINDWLEHIPEPVQKHITDAQAAMLRKEQELELLKEEMRRVEAKTAEQQRQLFERFQELEQKTNQAPKDIDLWSADGMSEYAKQQALQGLKDFYGPIVEEQQTRLIRQEIDAFTTKHKADLDRQDFKNKVATAMDEGFSMEQAYRMVKADEILAAKEAEEAERKQLNSNRRETVSKIGTGKSPAFPTRSTGSMWDIYQEEKRLAEGK